MPVSKSPAKATFMTAIVAFVLWFGLTAAWNTHKMQLRSRCSENLLKISAALASYESQFSIPPSTLDQLEAARLVEGADLRCPATELPNYAYSPGAIKSSQSVWVSEPLTNHGTGVHVLFGDGACKFVPQERLGELKGP